MGLQKKIEIAGDEFQELRAQYFDRGFTDCLKILPLNSLEPLHSVIYDHIGPFLTPHPSDLPLHEKLRLPLAKSPSYEDWRKLMKRVNDSQDFADLVQLKSEEVRTLFSKLFGRDTHPFPVCRFRAQYPGIQRSQYDWHQDEGTYYGTTVKDLSFWLAATLWISVNGCNKDNSIELIPGSHQGRLEYHKKQEGLGYFSAQVPRQFKSVTPYQVETEVGYGLLFHPLTFHRTRVISNPRDYRFSIDLRYVPEGGWKRERFDVSFRFFLKRLFTKSED